MSKPLLAGKVALISGGTRGLGAGIAQAALREGASVVVTGRRLAPESGETAERAHYVQTDVADVESARASVRATIERFGRIDCLVNAAGLTSRGTLLDTTPELFDQHIAVNLRGPFLTGGERPADGQARPGRRDRRLRGVSTLPAQRGRDGLGHRLGSAGIRRGGLT